MEQEKYYLEDIESGDRIEVSKDQYDNYHRAFQACIPDASKIVGVRGPVILMGTGGDLDKGDLEQLFHTPEKFANGSAG